LVEQSARSRPEASIPAICPASAIATTSSAIASASGKAACPAGAQYAFAGTLASTSQQPPDDITDITRHRPPPITRPVPTARRRRRGRRAMWKPRNPTLQSNPLVVAAAIAITGTSALLAADWLSVDRMQIHRIDATEAPTLDGDTFRSGRRNIQPYSVMTNEGGNFDGKGESRVDIRAVHDGIWAYFLFIWRTRRGR